MSTDMTYAEFMAHYGHAMPKQRTGPVKDLEDILFLIDVAAMILDDEMPSRVLTFEQILKAMRDLVDDGRELAAIDVHSVIATGVPCLKKVKGGWAWR